MWHGTCRRFGLQEPSKRDANMMFFVYALKTAFILYSLHRALDLSKLVFRNPTPNPMNRPEQAFSRAFHATNPSLKAVKRLEEIKDPPIPCLALLSWYLTVVSDHMYMGFSEN